MVSAQLVSTTLRLERGSIVRNCGVVADRPGGGKERSVTGESKKDLAVAVVRLLHSKLDAIDDETREVGVLRVLGNPSCSPGGIMSSSLCVFPWPPVISQVPNEWMYPDWWESRIPHYSLDQFQYAHKHHPRMN